MISIHQLREVITAMDFQDLQLVTKKNKFENDALHTIEETAGRLKIKPSKWLLQMITMKVQRIIDDYQVVDSAIDLSVYTKYFRYFISIGQ